VEAGKFRAFLDQTSQENDCVMIAGTDYSRKSEFLFLSSLADIAVVIVNERETRRKALAAMLHALKLNGVVVAGAVLNNQRHPLPGFLYRAV
jgi:Mrp family chromosome partitioning ATPase